MELIKGGGEVTRMLGHLRNSAMGIVDKKIAILFMHSNNVRNWLQAEMNVDNMVSQIIFDASSLARARSN